MTDQYPHPDVISFRTATSIGSEQENVLVDPSQNDDLAYQNKAGGNRMMKIGEQNRMYTGPLLFMASIVYYEILYTIASRPPESGGILLGPSGSNEVTDYYFDRGADCSGGTYSPDHVTLSRKMKEQWMPSGVDMKGFVHSHPGRFDQLSHGDVVYIRRLLEINPDMEMFAAPVVIPEEFRMRPIVVLRSEPTIPRAAKLVLF